GRKDQCCARQKKRYGSHIFPNISRPKTGGKARSQVHALQVGARSWPCHMNGRSPKNISPGIPLLKARVLAETAEIQRWVTGMPATRGRKTHLPPLPVSVLPGGLESHHVG